MKIDEAVKFWGKNVAVTCSDGQVFEGPMRGYQTHADEPDEPESVHIYFDDDGFKYAVEIPVEDIASITEA